MIIWSQNSIHNYSLLWDIIEPQLVETKLGWRWDQNGFRLGYKMLKIESSSIMAH